MRAGMAIDIFSVFKTYCGNNGGFVPTAYDDLSYEDKRRSGISLSDEHKEKISLFSKTNVNAISHWKKILESQKGKPKSETHKDNLRISNIGKIRSKIARKNMSDGWAKRKASLPEGTPIMARPDDIGARISAGWAKRRERLTTEQAIKIMHEDEQLALLDIASCL